MPTVNEGLGGGSREGLNCCHFKFCRWKKRKEGADKGKERKSEEKQKKTANMKLNGSLPLC